MAECTLVDFEKAEIELFVEKWTIAIERQAQGSEESARLVARRERDALLEVVEHNDGVRRLAANPLLLTILALMKRQGVLLPDRRVELYDRYVTTLLKHWNAARGLGRPLTRDLDVVETIRVLAPLALWIHETNPGVGLAKREDVRRKLVEIYANKGASDPEQSAARLMKDVRQHANLLLERGAGQYGFIHLTFQEYLAAIAIAQKGQQDVGAIVETLGRHIDDDTWHEVSLLAVGYLGIVQQRDEAAGETLLRLIKAAPGEPGAAATFAGEAAADSEPNGVIPDCRRQIRDALLATMVDDRLVAPRQRAAAGRQLARLGDPRPEITTVDGMQFCLVPAGSFWMGSGNGDKNARSNEKPLHQLDLPYDYYLARYPVTNAQFAEFTASGGYKEEAYWPEAVRNGYWQDGRYRDRDKPREDNHLFAFANQPQAYMSWYEAMAFCRWVTQRWRQKALLPVDWVISLPSEAEWEKGARGGLKIVQKPLPCAAGHWTAAREMQPNPLPQRLYPWGNESLDDNRANYGDSIGRTTAAGSYPQNGSPYGAAEMSGNVWEWTRSIGRPYPYQAKDGREEVGNVERNTWIRLRGGGILWRRLIPALRVSLHRPPGRRQLQLRVSGMRASPFSLCLWPMNL